MHAFVSTIPRNDPQIVMYSRIPRLWDESERISAHADPQIVTHSKKTVCASLIGEGLHIDTALPDFLQYDNTLSNNAACANVLEAVAGGAPVIPWRHNLASMIRGFGEEKTYVSRDGVVFTAGEFSAMR